MIMVSCLGLLADKTLLEVPKVHPEVQKPVPALQEKVEQTHPLAIAAAPAPDFRLEDKTLPKLSEPALLALRKKAELQELERLAGQDIYLLPSQRTGEQRFVPAAERERQRTISSEESFLKYCKPFIIPGRTDVVVVGYSGLTTPNYSLRRFLVDTFRRFGTYTELYSLYGNDGTKESLHSTTDTDMVNFLKERIDKLPKAPKGRHRPVVIGVGFSTGVAAMLKLEAEKPGTFDAIMAIGGPVEVKDPIYKVLLSAGDKIDKGFAITRRMLAGAERGLGNIQNRFVKTLCSPLHSALTWMRKSVAHLHERFVTMDIRLKDLSSYYRMLNPWAKPAAAPRGRQWTECVKESRKDPQFIAVPAGNYIAFGRIQKAAKKAVKQGKVHCPMFSAWGIEDNYAQAKKSDSLIRKHTAVDQDAVKERIRKNHQKHGKEAADIVTAQDLSSLQETHIYPETPHAVFFGRQHRAFKEHAWDYMAKVWATLLPSVPVPDHKNPTFQMMSGNTKRALERDHARQAEERAAKRQEKFGASSRRG